MVKNTGIPANQLSNLDPGQVLQDSHNIPLHALDVNVLNGGLVQSPYSKVVPTVDEYGRITNVKYYGLGLNEIINLVIPVLAQGKSEISTFSFTGLNPSDIAGKYVTIYDGVGKVVPWFDLDNGNSQPVVSGASRYVEIDIATGDSAINIASKFSAKLSLDSEFTSSPLLSTSVVQSLDVGARTDATAGNTGVLVAVGQQGVDSLAGKLFYLWKYDNSGKYAFYFTIDGSGAVPSHTGISLTQIALLSTDSVSDIATKTTTGISSIPYFSASATSGGQLKVTYRSSGNTSGFLDSDTGITSELVQDGQDLQLVQELIITYPTLCGPPIIEAVL